MSRGNRLETSQNRIEAQLQAILKNQQRTRTPILSHSLDASSPEGRQTWMELGRLLRDEGITPAMIRENRELLVNAMKSTLKAESVPESYVTAPEYKLNSYPLSVTESRNLSHQDFASAFSSINVFGSGPPRSTGFTDVFLERQSSAPGSLNQKQNVDNGIQSLLQGMNGEDSKMQNRHDSMHDVELEDVELENLMAEGNYEGEDEPLDKEPHQQRAVNHVVKPFVPTSERRDTIWDLEEVIVEGNYEGEDDPLDKDPHQQRAVNHVVKPLVPLSERQETSRDLGEDSAGVHSETIDWQKEIYTPTKYPNPPPPSSAPNIQLVGNPDFYPSYQLAVEDPSP